jgi:hypothetical protein
MSYKELNDDYLKESWEVFRVINETADVLDYDKIMRTIKALNIEWEIDDAIREPTASEVAEEAAGVVEDSIAVLKELRNVEDRAHKITLKRRGFVVTSRIEGDTIEASLSYVVSSSEDVDYGK